MFYEEVFRALNKARVKYVVAGGIAVNLYGVPRMTQDLDLLVELSPDNIEKLICVLQELGYKPRLPVDPKLIAEPSVRKKWITQKNMKVFNFFHKSVPAQEIDILVTSPIKVEDALKNKVVKHAGSLDIPLIAVSHLIIMKKKAGRPSDLSDIKMLKLIHKEK